jgi:hypothetical protein
MSIPITVIDEYGRGYNYFTEQLDIYNLVGDKVNHIINERKKVLELLHKAVADCFTIEQTAFTQAVLHQNKFQIYLKDIIEKAKGELK